MKSDIYNFFYPQSICLVGASARERSIGYEMLHSLSRNHFKGIIYPVNPKVKSILGYKCFKNISDIHDTIDLAILVVPKHSVECSIDLLIAKNVKSIIVITAGFKETGQEGKEIENIITEKVKSIGGRIVGPNCMGVINTLKDVSLNATFVAERPKIGRTGFLSQSGALGAAVLNSMRETDINFAHFISVGNKADVYENDLLKFWEKDENISTMTFYLESFENGFKFIEPFMKGEISKPVIVLKAGKFAGGMKAASSHTGALSSKDKVVKALLKQFGIIRVCDVNEMFNTSKGFENFPLPQGNRIAVVTNAGGPAILTVDALENEGLTLAKLSEETKAKLRDIVISEGSVENPIDLLPGANASNYKNVIEIIVEDENVDSVISIFVEPIMVQPFDVVESVSDIASGKPILQVDMPMPEFWDKYRVSSKRHLPIFKNPEDPATILSKMLSFYHQKKKIVLEKENYLKLLKIKNRESYNWEEGFLSVNNIKTLAREYELPLVDSMSVSTNELSTIPENYFPIVLKGINKKVVHKSDVDAVKINIKNRKELAEAAENIVFNFSKLGFDVESFLIQKYMDVKFEVLIGGTRDASFGPIIMFGSGGKYVEVLDDTAIRSAYLTENEIDDMLNETKVGKLLNGVRGEKPVDVKAIKSIIKNCSLMMLKNPEIKEFDINPLVVTKSNEIFIVDIRVKT